MNYRVAVSFFFMLSGATLFGGFAQAQTHTRSPQFDSMVANGWTYVRSFDSVSNVSITGYEDTVVATLYDGDNGRQTGTYFSLDGGKTLDHRWDIDQTPEGYAGYLFSNDPIYIAVPDAYEFWHDTIYLSKDLGATREKIYVDTAQFHFPRGAVIYGHAWLDPTDNGTIYIEFGRRTNDPNFPSASYSEIVRSTDTGHTWTKLELPLPRYGYGIERQMLMNERQRGQWYTMVTDGAETLIDWFKTSNDGKDLGYWHGITAPLGSSQFVDNGSAFGLERAGIGFSSEIRKLWGYDDGAIRGIAIKDGNSQNGYRVVSWTDSLVPGMPLHRINGNSFGIRFLYYADSNFVLLSMKKFHQMQNGDPIDSIRNWWFYSSDGGRSFIKLWDAPASAPITMDHRNPYRLWLVTPPASGGDTGTYNLYMREMPRSLSRVTNAPALTCRNISAFVTPSELRLENLPTNAEAVRLYDILGRLVFASVIRLYESKPVTFQISSPLPRGTYYISILASKGERVASLSVDIQ